MLHSTNFTGNECCKARHEASSGVFIVPCNQTSRVAPVVGTLTKAIKYSIISYASYTIQHGKSVPTQLYNGMKNEAFDQPAI